MQNARVTTSPPRYGDQFKLVSASELAGMDHEQRFIIADLVPVGQCGLIAGGPRSHKSEVALDLAVSAASGTPFLDQFPITTPCNVAVFSGNHDQQSLGESVSSTCEAKGLHLANLGAKLRWSTAAPRLGRDHERLRATIKQHNLGLIIVDPLQDALNGVRDDACEVMATLGPLVEVCRSTGCSLIVVTDTEERRGRHPDIHDVVPDGVASWARFWLLLSPEADKKATEGGPRVRLHVGANSGYGGAWTVDVDSRGVTRKKITDIVSAVQTTQRTAKQVVF